MMCNLRAAVSACVTSLAVRLTLHYLVQLVAPGSESTWERKIQLPTVSIRNVYS